MELSAESVLALAPDAASAKAANGLVKPAQWPTLGANPAAVWGECQGSGSRPYQTQVDLSGPTFKCSCPSRKFPCKHGLALLLLRARDASLFKLDTPPAWVSEWLGARTERVQKKEDKQREQALKPVDTQAALKSLQQRWSRIDAGVGELRQWLLDQVARGLGSLGPESRAGWETMAARLVDAKAPGLAQRLGSAAGSLMDGAGWPEKVLRQLGLLQLACEAVARRDALNEEAIADLRILLGWPLDKDAVLAQSPGVQDSWLVVGVIQEERDNNLQERRVWLHGQRTGRRALLLDHAFGGKGFEQAWFCGSSQPATLAFYPSAAPLRALVASGGTAASAASEPGASGSTPDEEWRAIAERIASNPWVPLHPLRCQQAIPCRDGDDRFGLHWAGRYLPLEITEAQGWALLALSGGQPVSVMGEWNGDMLRPLSAQGSDGIWNWSALSTTPP
ncbi:SWIM zinc finger family protein [Polaromonas hydrogenivorans]|uniref:SWIM zinc finger family protein n=1 Tax=Polaromonas hydrogenivorans TaxID=335476 RepID=A0AAU7LQF0_9BURK